MWPKRPAISSYWSIDSATYMLIKIYSPAVTTSVARSLYNIIVYKGVWIFQACWSGLVARLSCASECVLVIGCRCVVGLESSLRSSVVVASSDVEDGPCLGIAHPAVVHTTHPLYCCCLTCVQVCCEAREWGCLRIIFGSIANFFSSHRFLLTTFHREH